MPSSPFLLFFQFLICLGLSDGIDLVIVNSCNYSIWPALLGNAGHPTPRDGGFHLSPGEQTTLQLPNQWSGRMWPRQGCCFDSTTSKGSCQTGDCAGLLQCQGNGGAPPTSVVEMTFGTPVSGLHYYDVSLVNGFNVPVSMAPVGGRGGCGVAACGADLNGYCPERLVVRRGGWVVGCKSACVAARTDWYCCTGEYADPNKCEPGVFGRLFKAVCPRAYSYAYDDASGLMTCNADRYVITFCPHS